MHLLDQLNFGRQVLQRQPVRTALLLVAVSIGVAAVILLTSLGEGARRYVEREFLSLGSNMLFVFPGRTETTGSGPPLYGTTVRDLTLEDADAMRSVPGVTDVAPVVAGSSDVTAGRLSRSALVFGTTSAFFRIMDLRLGAGRGLDLEEEESAASVVVLGAEVKRELFGLDPAVGEWVRVGDRRMRVIGVLQERGESLGLDLRGMVLVPVQTAQQIFNSPGLFRALLSLRDSADPDVTEERLLALIRQRHQGYDDITVVSQDSVLGAFNEILTALTLAVGAIAAISLFVAGILIMNLSLISVSQRRQEIGLLKALGASARRVYMLFLGEAMLLIGCGVITGTLIAGILLYIESRIWPAFPLVPPVWAIPAAAGTAFICSLVFVWLPAWRAARLDPVLALRGVRE